MAAFFTSIRRGRLLTALFVVAFSLLVMGAKQVTQEIKDRPRRSFDQHQEWREWSCNLLTTVPNGQRGDWKRVADENPLLLVQACAATAARESETRP